MFSLHDRLAKHMASRFYFERRCVNIFFDIFLIYLLQYSQPKVVLLQDFFQAQIEIYRLDLQGDMFE